MDTQSFHAAAAALRFETRAFINGRFVDAQSGLTFATVNPANGCELAQVAECDVADVNLAVAAARRAFESGSWSRQSPKARKRVLLRFAELIERDAESLALLEVLDSGKPITDARTVDVPDAVESLRWHAELTDKLYDQMSPTPGDVVSMIVREPIGVVAAVLPWNFPIFVAMWKIAPALAGGNSLLIKPAEQTSLTALRLAELATEAGVPPGVFNVLPGFGETAGQALGRHGDVDCISFTGSTEVGRLFLRYASESNLKRVVLELGGKSPVVVLDDVADLQRVADHVATGILFCQGENCSAGSRLIVHRSMKAPLLDLLKTTFAGWSVGDPLDPTTRVGAMIEQGHMQRVLRYIEHGCNEGAQLVLGGRQVRADSGGWFVEPTIFDGVRNDMIIGREEIFGPVLSIIEAGSVEEAVRLANDTNYGLAASLYTDSLDRAHTVARQIRAGTVSVNCYSEGDTAVPFGGYKQSGFGGRDKGLAAHDQYLQSKSIWMQLR